MTQYIALPLKGMADADWSSPLGIYFTTTYGSAKDYMDDISQFNKLRINVRGASPDKNGRAIVINYYKQLEVLELRVPVNDTSCRINFTWQDAFSKAPTTQHSLAYEKASLLFNIAAISSHIAADADDPRLTYKAFQEASGLLQFIFDKFLHAPSTDLTQETVKALNKLMLAQGQEAFVATCLSNESSKPAMNAKLAKGASKLYSGASSILKDIFEEKSWGEKAWYQLASIKSKYYLAVAHNQQALACEQKGKYGNAIVHLQTAKSTLQEVVAITIPTPYSQFSEYITNLGKSVSEHLTTLEKDNDFIYHDDIPLSSSVAEITALEAAKPKPMNEIIGQEEFKGLFSNVYSMSTYQSSSVYSEEKAKLLRIEDEKMEVADQTLNSGFEFLEFPKALSEVRTILYPTESSSVHAEESNAVDRLVNDWAQQISSAPPISNAISDLEKLRLSVYNIIKDAEGLLKSEETEYNNYKAQFKDRWTQASSTLMATGLWGDASRIKRDLAQGTTDDNVLIRNISEHQKEIDILSAGPSNPKLISAFKNIDKAGGSSQEAPSLLDLDTTPDTFALTSFQECEDIVTTLRKLQKERNATFADFKKTVRDDDISTVLTLNKNQPGFSEEELFKEELKKFNPYINRLDQMTERESDLIKRLTVVWGQLLQDPTIRNSKQSQKASSSKRASLIEQFQTAYLGWVSFNKRSTAGMTYYRNLEKNATVLKNNASELVANRREEGSKLKDSLQGNSAQDSQDFLKEQLARMSIGSSASPSPRGSYSSAPIPGGAYGQQQQGSFYPSQPRNTSVASTSSFSSHSSPAPAAPQTQQQQQPPQWDLSMFEKPTPSLPPKPQSYSQVPTQPLNHNQHQYQAPSQYQQPSGYGAPQQPQQSQPAYSGYQPQSYGEYQQQPPPVPQQLNYNQPQYNPYYSQHSTQQQQQPPQQQPYQSQQYYGGDRGKDYSSLPPPPPPPPSSGYY